MKKVVSVLLLVIVLITALMPVAAMAEKHSFSISNVECWSESAPTKYYNTKIWKYNSIARLYVDHDALGTSNGYTNLFHAMRSDLVGDIGIASGNKWCTPAAYVPIQSNAIYQNFYYGLGARGNTKYSQFEGLQQFNVSGGFDPNYIP
ncbi:MAG: hypothetical protein RR505_12255 [Raoultibacter sp.]